MSVAERELYWAIRTAQTRGISVEKFFETAREVWRDVRAEMTEMENLALAETRPVGGAGELTAALEATLSYLETLVLEHSPDCSYESTDSPRGDFCDCGLKARKVKRSQVYMQLQGALAEFNASLAAKAPQGVPGQREVGDLKVLAEHITHLIQSLLTLKYENSFKVAHGIIERELLRFNAALAAPPAPSLPVPGPVSDTTIHHGMFPPAPSVVAAKCVNCGQPIYDNGTVYVHRKVLNASTVLETQWCHGVDKGFIAETELSREAAAPKPAPGAERLLKAGDEVWVRGKVTDSRPLSSGAIVVAMSDSSGDDDGVVFVRPEDVREALAAAPSAPTNNSFDLGAAVKNLHDLQKVGAAMGLHTPPTDVESLAATFHDIYQQEAKRQGDVRHKDAYADLPDNVKEFDRVLARYVLANFGDHASAERVRELIAKWRNGEDNWTVDRPGHSLAMQKCADELERALPPSTGEKGQ